ncbi:MAG: hypothetical protein ACOX6O_08290 [Christensenellales bacterium]|jgi:hypothetical protein
MMNNAFKDRVDSTLSGLSWREADSRAALGIMKGDIKVKKRLTFGMAIAMALILATMAIAVAEIIRYSVRDYQQIGDEAVKEHIAAIGQELKQEDVEIYVTDAIFDGSVLSLAFEAKPISGKPVYVVASLTASMGTKTLKHHVLASQGMGFDQGFWVPERMKGGSQGKYGLDVEVDAQDLDGDISWELRFDVLRPVWEIVEDTSGYSDDADGTADDHEAWQKQFETAFNHQQIMLTQGHSLMMLENYLPQGDDMAQRLVASGAFEEAGMLKADWVSPAVARKSFVPGMVIKGDGFEVELLKLNTTFMRTEYEFVLTVTNPDKRAELWNQQGELRRYAPIVQGMKLREVDSGAGVRDYDEKATQVVYTGAFTHADELPDSLTFKPYFYNNKGEKEFNDSGEFTLKIK